MARELGKAPVVELAEVAEELLEPRQRVLRLPFVHHGAIADVREVRPHRVLHPAERLHLEERRPAAGTGELERAATASSTASRSLPSIYLTRHAVPGCAVGEIFDGAERAPVGRERELIVLADEDDRKLPRGSQVHRLVRCSLAGRPIPEERECRLARRPELRREPRTTGMRKPGSDDPVATEDVQRHVGDVHRAPEALAVAGPPTEHLGHHPADIGSGSDQMAVRAVVADEVVAFPHHARRPDGDRLLADAAVRRPDDHALLEELGSPFLEHANQQHQAVLLDERAPIGRPENLRSRHVRSRRVGAGGAR